MKSTMNEPEQEKTWIDQVTIWDCWIIALCSWCITMGPLLNAMMGIGLWIWHENTVRREVREGKR